MGLGLGEELTFLGVFLFAIQILYFVCFLPYLRILFRFKEPIVAAGRSSLDSVIEGLHI